MDDMELEKAAVKEVDRHPGHPTARKIFEDNAHFAASTLAALLFNGSENVKLAAARDLLDRAGYKPIERKDITSAGQALPSPVLSDEQLMNAINGFLKRTAIDVPGREVERTEGNLPPGP